MTEPTPEELIEEIEVEVSAEPVEPEEGVIDPADTYTEGGQGLAAEAEGEGCC